MRILYVITQADGGGAQKYVLQLAKHFGGEIAAGNEATKLFDEAEGAGLIVHHLKHLKRNMHPWHDLLAVWEIRQLLDSCKPDIVHLNSSKAGVLGSFAAIGKKTKTIFTAHGFVFNEPLPKPAKAFYLALEKIASDYRDLIIAVSEADRQSALKHNLIESGKIVTIRNGIPQIDFLPQNEAREKLGLVPIVPNSDNSDVIRRLGSLFIFGTIANFYKTKGLDILIEAISKINKNLLEKVQFVVIGSGPEKDNLKLKIENLKLSDNIKLLGKIERADKYLHAFDVFVLPSRKEGMPYTVLEAMQAGLPIVATDVGGVREALDDAGTIIPPEDADGLANTLSAIIESCVVKKDFEPLKILSEKVLVQSREFTESRMIEETASIYRKVLKLQE